MARGEGYICGARVVLGASFQGDLQESQPHSRGRLQVWLQFRPEGSHPGLWQMFRTFVLRCDWSILQILKSTKKHERQSERVTLVSIYNNIFRLYHN